MSEQIKALVGQWVEVRWGAGSGPAVFPSYVALPSLVYGLVEECDDYALLLRKLDGETLYLPLDSIRSMKPVAPPRQAQDQLLRPSEAPDANSLVRPAAGPSEESNYLLRPDEEILG